MPFYYIGQHWTICFVKLYHLHLIVNLILFCMLNYMESFAKDKVLKHNSELPLNASEQDTPTISSYFLCIKSNQKTLFIHCRQRLVNATSLTYLPLGGESQQSASNYKTPRALMLIDVVPIITRYQFRRNLCSHSICTLLHCSLVQIRIQKYLL